MTTFHDDDEVSSVDNVASNLGGLGLWGINISIAIYVFSTFSFHTLYPLHRSLTYLYNSIHLFKIITDIDYAMTCCEPR